MMIANQHHPFGAWLAMPSGPVCPALPRSAFALPSCRTRTLPRTEDSSVSPRWCDTGAASTPDGARLRPEGTAGKAIFSRRNHNVTCRTLPSSVNLLNARSMLSWIRRSGPSPSCRSRSSRSPREDKTAVRPAGPFGGWLRAISAAAGSVQTPPSLLSCPRANDHSPDSDRRLHRNPATTAPTRPHIQIRWCQSRPFRANREASMQNTAPTSPVQTSATRR